MIRTKAETRGIERGAQTRRATTDDLPTIARIHKIAYSRSHFTTLLPDDVLVRYYGYFLDGGSEICLALDGAENSELENRAVGEVHGFAVFGEGIPERITRFKRECFWDIFFTSLRHPWSAARKALFVAFARLAKRPAYPPAAFLLLSIAVAVPRHGIGSRLLSAVLEAAQQRGLKTVGLYVNADNVSAINAYLAAGFRVIDFQGGQYYMEWALERENGKKLFPVY